jgi:hypothetical protein
MVSFMVLLLTQANQHIYAPDISNLIYTNKDSPFENSYSYWAKEWWVWHSNLPSMNVTNPDDLSRVHPREHYSSEKCGWDQTNENVHFLPDGSSRGNMKAAEVAEKRYCVVPHDKALLVLIYGGVCSEAEKLYTKEARKACVEIGLDDVRFYAALDGVKVIDAMNLSPTEKREKYLAGTQEFDLTLKKVNAYDLPSGTWDAMSDGYFVFTPHLSLGNHTLSFYEYFYEPAMGSIPEQKRISNTTYILNVVNSTI